MKADLRRAYLIIALCCVGYLAQAQEIIRSTDTVKKSAPPIARQKPKGPKAIKHEVSGGFRLNPTEIKTTSTDGTGSNSYVYGKINNFYSLKLGWGFRRLIAGKPDPGTVSIHWVNTGGVALGLLKPYYLNVFSDPSAIEYKDPNKVDFLNQPLIEGSAGFSKGLSQLTFIPGFHFKSALHFDFSNNRKMALAVETGLNVEYYTSPIALMADQPAVPYFCDLFVAIQFGKRW